jgi:hypothetical protein
MAKKDWSPPSEVEEEGEGGVAFSVELPRSAGINWGSDISFRWIYVIELDPNGAAAATGLIKKVTMMLGCIAVYSRV